MGSYKLPNGQALNLMYNGIVLLKLREGDAVKFITTSDEALFDVACALAEGGELWNRYMGFESSRIPTPEDFSVLDKAQKLALRISVLKTIIEDSGETADGEEEYEDVVLAELNAKKKESESELMVKLLSAGAMAGITPKESLIIPVGLLNKLAEIGAKRGGSLFRWPMA